MMKPRLVNYKRFYSFISVKHTFLRSSSGGEQPKRDIFKKKTWHLSMKAKAVIAFVIIAVMLISVFVFIPKGDQSTPNVEPVEPQSNDPTASPSPTTQQTPSATQKPSFIPDVSKVITNVVAGLLPPKLPGIIESNEYADSGVWRAVAANAWQYFKPGTGVDQNTGLPGADLFFPYFTDWDLGVYIQAVMDAQKIGLIGKNETWGADYRLDKVLTFLETRELNNDSYPFWFYEAKTGYNYKAQSDLTNSSVDVIDTGKLLVALDNVKDYNSAAFAQRVDNLVYNSFNNRSNYEALVPEIRSENRSYSIYAYYVASGFAAFWPEISDVPGKILDNILNGVNGTRVQFDGGITLPASEISCEPLLHSIFDLKNNANNTKLMNLVENVYWAHEAKYNATGQYVAFSEGNSPYGFIYEWVVQPNGDKWIIKSGDNSELYVEPIIYTKVALSFLSLYNTTYARNTVIYLERCLPDPTRGYCGGADFIIDIGAKILVNQVGSNTNGLILSAARYALRT
jgi:hypothetical protein